MILTIKRLESGYYRISGSGPCNWAQVPCWPCSDRVLDYHTFREASREFRAAVRVARNELDDAARGAAR